jgi:hypothetical protein
MEVDGCAFWADSIRSNELPWMKVGISAELNNTSITVRNTCFDEIQGWDVLRDSSSSVNLGTLADSGKNWFFRDTTSQGTYVPTYNVDDRSSVQDTIRAQYNVWSDDYYNYGIVAMDSTLSGAAQVSGCELCRGSVTPRGSGWSKPESESEAVTIVPWSFELSENYPNPFNPSTTISFTLPEIQHVTLDVLNVLGQRVKVLVNESREAGPHEIVWDGTNDSGDQVASGVYFYRISTGEHIASKKMLLLK